MRRTILLIAAVAAVGALTGCTQYYLDKGDDAMSEQRYVDALKNYQKALDGKAELSEDAVFMEKYHQARFLAPYEEGQQLAAEGRYGEAIAKFQQCLDIEPGYKPAAQGIQQARRAGSMVRLNRAHQYADAGRLEAAAGEARAALDFWPGNQAAQDALDSLAGTGTPNLREANRLLLEARRLAGEKRWLKAVEALQTGLAANPNHLPARAELTRYRETLEQAQRKADAGYAELGQRRLDAAIRTLTEALEVWPHNPTAGEHLEQAKAQRQQAEALYEKALELSREDHWDEAAQAANEALRIYPYHARAKDFTQDVGQRAADAFARDGDTLLARGDLDVAEEKFRAALRYEPDHRGAQQGLASAAMTRGREAERRGYWGNAMLWYLDASEAYPSREADNAVSRMRAKIAQRIAFAMSLQARSRVAGLPADMGAVQWTLATAVSRNAPPFLETAGAGAPVLHNAYADVTQFGTSTHRVRSENRVHVYQQMRDVANPAIPRLRRAIDRAQRELQDLINAGARPAVVQAKRDEIAGLHRRLAGEPRFVRQQVELEWPYEVVIYHKTAEATCDLRIEDRQRKAVARDTVREAAVFEDEVIENANPDIGLQPDPLDLPTDAEACRSLMEALAVKAAARLVQQAVEARIAEVRATADDFSQRRQATASVEAYVDLWALTQPGDEAAAEKILGQLRAQAAERRQLYQLGLRGEDGAAEPPAENVVRAMAVDIEVHSPPDWLRDETWDRFVLVRRDASEWQAQVMVSGPRDVVGDLAPRDVKTFVALTDADLAQPAGQWQTREAVVLLPRGVTVAGRRPTVTFRLDRR